MKNKDYKEFLKYELVDAEINLDRKAQEIINLSEYLVGNLIELNNKLIADGALSATINTLGVLQGSGPELDRKLGELDECRERYKQILRIINYNNKE